MPCNTSIFLLALRTATCKLTTRRCSECVVFSHSDKVIVTQHLTDNFTSSVTPPVITDETPLPCLRVLYVHITLTLNTVNIQKKHVSRCCGKVRNCQILCFCFVVFLRVVSNVLTPPTWLSKSMMWIWSFLSGYEEKCHVMHCRKTPITK